MWPWPLRTHYELVVAVDLGRPPDASPGRAGGMGNRCSPQPPLPSKTLPKTPEDASHRLATAKGPPRTRLAGAPATLAASIEERVRGCPDGALWTYGVGGNHRSQSYLQ